MLGETGEGEKSSHFGACGVANLVCEICGTPVWRFAPIGWRRGSILNVDGILGCGIPHLWDGKGPHSLQSSHRSLVASHEGPEDSALLGVEDLNKVRLSI